MKQQEEERKGQSINGERKPEPIQEMNHPSQESDKEEEMDMLKIVELRLRADNQGTQEASNTESESLMMSAAHDTAAHLMEADLLLQAKANKEKDKDQYLKTTTKDPSSVSAGGGLIETTETLLERYTGNNRRPLVHTESMPGAFAQSSGGLAIGNEDGEQSDIESTDAGLVEAMPVKEEDRNASDLMEAQPVEQRNSLDQKQAAREAEDKKWKQFGCCFAWVASLVLVIALAIGLTNNQKEPSVDKEAAPSQPPTGSPTRLLPPMENLELLYSELPETTKESLYNKDTPQYQAWEWVLHHPNITTYPQWRKKQMFAMATFYYSFEGPIWPDETPNRDRWMDVYTNECSWVLSEAESAFYAQQSAAILGPAYEPQDFQPCNDDGQLQLLAVHQLFLPTNATPSIPPEIELLESLKILAVVYSRISAKLSDLLVPEVIQLPSLVLLNFAVNGVSGTIPKDIGRMTGLRHFLATQNRLTGSIPTQIANMNSLEFFSASQMEALTGELPSELGLMTSLTGLYAYGSSITGRIPSELGLMPRLQSIEAQNCAFTGLLPSELGMLTSATGLFLGNNLDHEGSSNNNNFTGSVPTELWQLSHLEWLFLPNLPNLHGRVPNEMAHWMPNLTHLSLSGTPHVSGTIPEQFCSPQEEGLAPAPILGKIPLPTGQALDIDCSAWLCGCNCECTSGDNNVTETNHGLQLNHSLP